MCIYLMIIDIKFRKVFGKKRDDIEIIFDLYGFNVRISQVGKILFFYWYCWVGKVVKFNVGDYFVMSIIQVRECC